MGDDFYLDGDNNPFDADYVQKGSNVLNELVRDSEEGYAIEDTMVASLRNTNANFEELRIYYEEEKENEGS